MLLEVMERKAAWNGNDHRDTEFVQALRNSARFQRFIAQPPTPWLRYEMDS
jgi:hypothetical protein